MASLQTYSRHARSPGRAVARPAHPAEIEPDTSARGQSTAQNARQQARRGYSSLVGGTLHGILSAAGEGQQPEAAATDMPAAGAALLQASGKHAAALDDLRFACDNLTGGRQGPGSLPSLARQLLCREAPGLMRRADSLSMVVRAASQALRGRGGSTWKHVQPLQPSDVRALAVISYCVTCSPMAVQHCTRAFIRLLLLATRDAVITARTWQEDGEEQPASSERANEPNAAECAKTQPRPRLSRFRKRARPASAAHGSPSRAGGCQQGPAPAREADQQLKDAWAAFWTRTQPPQHRRREAGPVDPSVAVPVSVGGMDAALSSHLSPQAGSELSWPLVTQLLLLSLLRCLAVLDVPDRHLQAAARATSGAAQSQTGPAQVTAVASSYVSAVRAARKVVMGVRGVAVLAAVLRRLLKLLLLDGGQDSPSTPAAAVLLLCCLEQLVQDGEASQMSMVQSTSAPGACEWVPPGQMHSISEVSAPVALTQNLPLASLILAIPYQLHRSGSSTSAFRASTGLALHAMRVLVNMANENPVAARAIASAAPAVLRKPRARGPDTPGQGELSMLHVSPDEGALGRRWPGLATVMTALATASAATLPASGDHGSKPGATAKRSDAFDVLITCAVAVTNLVEQCPPLQSALAFGPDGGSLSVTPPVHAGHSSATPGGISSPGARWVSLLVEPFAARYAQLRHMLDDMPASPAQSADASSAASQGVSAQDVVAGAYLALLISCTTKHSADVSAHVLGATSQALRAQRCPGDASLALATTLKSFVRLQSSAGVLTEEVLTRIAGVVKGLEVEPAPTPAPASECESGTTNVDSDVCEARAMTSSQAWLGTREVALVPSQSEPAWLSRERAQTSAQQAKPNACPQANTPKTSKAPEPSQPQLQQSSEAANSSPVRSVVLSTSFSEPTGLPASDSAMPVAVPVAAPVRAPVSERPEPTRSPGPGAPAKHPVVAATLPISATSQAAESPLPGHADVALPSPAAPKVNATARGVETRGASPSSGSPEKGAADSPAPVVVPSDAGRRRGPKRPHGRGESSPGRRRPGPVPFPSRGSSRARHATQLAVHLSSQEDASSPVREVGHSPGATSGTPAKISRRTASHTSPLSVPTPALQPVSRSKASSAARGRAAWLALVSPPSSASSTAGSANRSAIRQSHSTTTTPSAGGRSSSQEAVTPVLRKGTASLADGVFGSARRTYSSNSRRAARAAAMAAAVAGKVNLDAAGANS